MKYYKALRASIPLFMLLVFLFALMPFFVRGCHNAQAQSAQSAHSASGNVSYISEAY